MRYLDFGAISNDKVGTFIDKVRSSSLIGTEWYFFRNIDLTGRQLDDLEGIMGGYAKEHFMKRDENISYVDLMGDFNHSPIQWQSVNWSSLGIRFKSKLKGEELVRNGFDSADLRFSDTPFRENPSLIILEREVGKYIFTIHYYSDEKSVPKLVRDLRTHSNEVQLVLVELVKEFKL